MARRCAFGVVAPLALLVVECARNPATGERQLNLVSREQEIALGKQAAEEVKQTVGFYDAPALQEYVSELGRRLAAKSERADLPWSFAVVDDPAMNAFALPGGYIFVTRGLLPYLENEAQLAGVLAHEIGHVTAQHSVNRVSKAQLTNVGLGVGMLLSEEVRRWAPLGLVGLNLLFLKFSRDDEREADRLSVRYALRGGYDVREIPDVYATFDRVSDQHGQGRLPQWLATHPAPENRVAATREQVAELDLTGIGKLRDRAEYLRTIEGTVYGPDPRQGIVRGQRFLHPALRFSVEVPQGWTMTNLSQALVASSPQKDAVFQLTVSTAQSPEAGRSAFAAQPGIDAADSAGPQLSVPSASARFTARTEQGPVAGLVTYAGLDGRTFQLLFLAPAGSAGALLPTFEQTARSFSRLTDSEALNVKPNRLRIVRPDSRISLAELYRQRPAAVPLEEIALINDLAPDSTIEPDRLIKWVRE